MKQKIKVEFEDTDSDRAIRFAQALHQMRQDGDATVIQVDRNNPQAFTPQEISSSRYIIPARETITVTFHADIADLAAAMAVRML